MPKHVERIYQLAFCNKHSYIIIIIHQNTSSSSVACPYWSVAVSTRDCRIQNDYRASQNNVVHDAKHWQAECRPRTVGHVHSLTHVQVKCGRPFGLLQDAGGLWIAARRARWWSNIGSDLTMWPNRRRRLCRMSKLEYSQTERKHNQFIQVM